MTHLLTPFVALISFITVVLVAPAAIRFFRQIGLTVVDIHKIDKPLVPRAGGLIVMAGMFAGLMVFIFIRTFLFQSNNELVYVLAAIVTLFLISFAGFIDDLPVIKDKSSYKEENKPFRLRQRQKILLVLPALIPLMAVSAGVSKMYLPFVGSIDFGILYPLLLVPIGVFGAANMVNLLEGLNGLGSGMGIIYTGMLGAYAYTHNRPLAAIIAFAAFGALLSFWFFHKTPAKIHAGDSLTYLLGAVIATIAIIGNMEKAAIIVSIPFFIELGLKLRGKLKKDTIGYVDEKGKLHSKWKKIYSIPHIFMRTGKFTERQIVYFMIFIELGFSSLIWVL